MIMYHHDGAKNEELTIKGTGIQIGIMAPRHSTYVTLNTLKITLYKNYNYGDSSKTMHLLYNYL